MNQRIVFFIVFIFTLVSTLLVFTVCLMSDQTWLVTALFSLATMWVVGIISQLILHHLYLAVVKPIEDKKFEEKIRETHEHHYTTEGIEKITDFEGKQVEETAQKPEPVEDVAEQEKSTEEKAHTQADADVVINKD